MNDDGTLKTGQDSRPHLEDFQKHIDSRIRRQMNGDPVGLI